MENVIHGAYATTKLARSDSFITLVTEYAQTIHILFITTCT